MASGSSNKTERSYLSSAIDSINPWNSNKTTVKNNAKRHEERPVTPVPKPHDRPVSEDHCTTPFYGQSFRSYPWDCPPLSVRWFHAVDVPKRKPQLVKGRQSTKIDLKSPVLPKKFVAFSVSDSMRIEGRYQRVLETTEDRRIENAGLSHRLQSSGDERYEAVPTEEVSSTINLDMLIPVNEDFLFDTNIEQRELYPVYWLGPVYEIRRGTWFYREGSSLRPCEENLAVQLEEGYLKLKPWEIAGRLRSQSLSKSTLSSGEDAGTQVRTEITQKKSNSSKMSVPEAVQSPHPPQLPSYRLFGAYMNNVATYQDADTAWLTSDSMLSWVTTSVYERFAGGGHLSGIKLTRGYSESSEGKEAEQKETVISVDNIPPIDENRRKVLNRMSAPAMMSSTHEPESQTKPQTAKFQEEEILLQRRLSKLIDREREDDAREEVDIQSDEQEIQHDYNTKMGESQGRDIDHLILVTHGIGQRLGLRMESVNFVHDVNVLRKTLKSVYAGSADLKALNSELEVGPGNSRVQVLPVCWRHMLEFPRSRTKKAEHDLGVTSEEEDSYPSLEDITVEGVAFARSLISDLALDVLLYQSSYREEISKIVLEESNRIFKLFKERNPEFRGKVHLMGHSLGSAILFDVLCRQKDQPVPEEPKQQLQLRQAYTHGMSENRNREMRLDFDVDDFYCLGSPIGLFQMLQGRTIAARSTLHTVSVSRSSSCSHLDGSSTAFTDSISEVDSSLGDVSASISSPRVGQLFNIFHPSDPVSYRLEPLISTVMTSLKPQPLPYTKKSIFGSVAPHGLTSIGAKVGQSVSGLWSSLSAGIASNILRSSLRLGNDEVMQMTQQQSDIKNNYAPEAYLGDLEDDKKNSGQHKVGVVSHGNEVVAKGDFETLYSQFQKKRQGVPQHGGTDGFREENHKSRKIRAEEGKVRALNQNGRVDYSIQESALDFNPINAIASHMSYWADEDVGHFVLSQILSRQTKKQAT